MDKGINNIKINVHESLMTLDGLTLLYNIHLKQNSSHSVMINAYTLEVYSKFNTMLSISRNKLQVLYLKNSIKSIMHNPYGPSVIYFNKFGKVSRCEYRLNDKLLSENSFEGGLIIANGKKFGSPSVEEAREVIMSRRKSTIFYHQFQKNRKKYNKD